MRSDAIVLILGLVAGTGGCSAAGPEPLTAMARVAEPSWPDPTATKDEYINRPISRAFPSGFGFSGPLSIEMSSLCKRNEAHYDVVLQIKVVQDGVVVYRESDRADEVQPPLSEITKCPSAQSVMASPRVSGGGPVLTLDFFSSISVMRSSDVTARIFLPSGSKRDFLTNAERVKLGKRFIPCRLGVGEYFVKLTLYFDGRKCARTLVPEDYDHPSSEGSGVIHVAVLIEYDILENGHLLANRAYDLRHSERPSLDSILCKEGAPK